MRLDRYQIVDEEDLRAAVRDTDTYVSTLPTERKKTLLKHKAPNGFTIIILTEVNPALPKLLWRIIRRCLAKDPERRYQSAKDIRNELEELRGRAGLGRARGGSYSSRPILSVPRHTLGERRSGGNRVGRDRRRHLECRRDNTDAGIGCVAHRGDASARPAAYDSVQHLPDGAVSGWRAARIRRPGRR